MGHIVEAQNLYRGGGQSLLNLFTTVVDHGAYLTKAGAGNNGIADVQGTALYQNGGNGATALIQLCLDDGAMCGQIRVSLQLLHFSNQKNHFQKVGNTGLLMCGYGNHDGISAPILGDEAVLSQLLLNVVGVCAHTVHLVNCNDNGHLCCLSMVNSFNGLRHYAIVCSYYQNSHVGYLGTTGTHSGEGFVTGGIQKDDLLALVINFICTNVLGNTASLACSNISFTNSVQQRCFAVVNVTHNSDYRRTG